MEFIVLTIIFCFYVLYNEIHKRRIKNEKKEFKIPKEFYENLKDTINYIDYSLELIKQKQENINKVYIKLMELKKDLEDTQNKKRSKKKRLLLITIRLIQKFPQNKKAKIQRKN